MKPDLFSSIVATDVDWNPKAPPSLDGINEIELDCETDGLEWWNGNLPVGIAIRLPNGKCQYLPWAHRGGGNLDENVMKRWAHQELRGKRITNIRTKFDVHMLYAWDVDLEKQGCTVSDVAHYAALLDDSRRKFSLEELSQEFLGEGKVKGLVGEQMAEYHAGEVDEYAQQDVRLVAKLKEKFWPMLTEQDLHRVRELEDDMIFPVCEMERNAAPLDIEKLHRWEKDSEQEFLRCLWHIYRETNLKVNPKSPKDLLKLFRVREIAIAEYTEKGQASFTDRVLKEITDPVIVDLVKARRLAELRSKYLVSYKNAVGSDGILRFDLHQLRTDKFGTNRGRFSMSNKNLQAVLAAYKQIEKYGEDYIIRELFVPKNGLWLSADAAQIEFRLFAHYANSPSILKRYEEDPEVSFHEIIHKMALPFRPDIKYRPVKDLNFAKIYGAGRRKVSMMLGIPQKESDPFVDLYNRLLPEADKLLKLAARIAEQRGYVCTLLGRRARFLDKRFFHKALNAIIQGSAADIMKRKLIELHRECKELVLRLTVHDEVCGDIPDESVADKVREILNSQSFDLRVPILWKVNTGANWKEAGKD